MNSKGSEYAFCLMLVEPILTIMFSTLQNGMLMSKNANISTFFSQIFTILTIHNIAKDPLSKQRQFKKL